MTRTMQAIASKSERLSVAISALAALDSEEAEALAGALVPRLTNDLVSRHAPDGAARLAHQMAISLVQDLQGKP